MDSTFERRAWTLIYVCLGVIEGGTAAVMVRSLFATAAPPLVVDLVLAVVSAAPAWANLLSLAFARRAQGRPKVPFLRPLLLAMAVCVAALAALPRGGVGLVAFLLIYGTARLLWAGVDTVRSVIWSVNSPRRLRARVTGRILVNGSIALAASGLLLGWLLEHDDPWYRAAILAGRLAASSEASRSGDSVSDRSSDCSPTNSRGCVKGRASIWPAFATCCAGTRATGATCWRCRPSVQGTSCSRRSWSCVSTTCWTRAR